MRTLSLLVLPSLVALSLLPRVAAAADQADGASGAAKSEKSDAKPASLLAAIGSPAARIKRTEGFAVDLIYSVPKDTQGSWVNMAVDPQGRLIVSDQYGELYRVTVPALGAAAAECQIEPIDVAIGEAHGLLWAFDSLYVVVNKGKTFETGLYRVRDTNGDDRLDSVEQLRKIIGGGEHGPHGIILAPDGKSLYIVAGNNTHLPELRGSLVPRVWGEDNLLPRMVDGGGFMTGEKAPVDGSAASARTARSGSSWRWVFAIRSTSPSITTASCSRTTPTWSGT